jgi:hypothetical protein
MSLAKELARHGHLELAHRQHALVVDDDAGHVGVQTDARLRPLDGGRHHPHVPFGGRVDIVAQQRPVLDVALHTPRRKRVIVAAERRQHVQREIKARARIELRHEPRRLLGERVNLVVCELHGAVKVERHREEVG